MIHSRCLATAAVVCAMTGAATVEASDMTYVDPCIDADVEANGPGVARGGEVISQEFSEAGTLMILEDASGATWRCISYKDEAVGELTKLEDGTGNAPPASWEATTETETVRFKVDDSGAELTGSLTPGSSRRYVLGASDGQFLYVRVAPRGGILDYEFSIRMARYCSTRQARTKSTVVSFS